MTSNRQHLVIDGRFVSGSITEMQTTDHQNQPVAPDKHHFWFGVAVQKTHAEIDQIRAQIAAYAMEDFAQAPHIQQLIQQYNYAPNSGFSWKIKDGDAVTPGQQPNPHTAGCWIFGFRTGYAINCSDQGNADIPADQIKRGYFVQVAFSVSGNGLVTNQAGIYLNPIRVRLVAYGQEIQGGMSADQAFAGHDLPTQLPAGASLTPLPSGPMAVPQGNPPVGSSVPGQPPMPPGSPPVTPTAPPNMPLTTGAPTNPQASVSVLPHPTFANGPQANTMPTAAPMQTVPAGVGAPGMPVATSAPAAYPSNPAGIPGATMPAAPATAPGQLNQSTVPPTGAAPGAVVPQG